VTEALLAYFLSLMHITLAAAVAAVAIYRLANIAIPTLPAFATWPRVRRMVERSPTTSARRRSPYSAHSH
jgi:uncharacterized membrane protein YbhN (UPF0104 family)